MIDELHECEPIPGDCCFEDAFAGGTVGVGLGHQNVKLGVVWLLFVEVLEEVVGGEGVLFPQLPVGLTVGDAVDEHGIGVGQGTEEGDAGVGELEFEGGAVCGRMQN